MIIVRRAGERGVTRLDWLDSRHTFSFGEYWDPDWMGFRELRVLNDDRVRPARGFGTHAHRDMEILTYVLAGELEHKDSMGNGSVIARGDVQVMSAGTGIMHSEFNPSADREVHFLQIWVVPERRGLPPRYEQKRPPEPTSGWQLIAAPAGGPQAVVLHQDVRIHRTLAGRDERLEHAPGRGRHAYLHVIDGAVEAGGQRLSAGDGMALSDEARVAIQGAGERSELLLFDLA